MTQALRGSAKVCSAKSVKEFLVTTVTRISDHNCDEDYQLLPIEMPCLLLLHCTGPLPIASACRQGNSREKKNCSIFAPFNYFSQTLCAFQAFLPIFEPFKNVSQSSFTPATLERGNNVALILPVNLFCSHSLQVQAMISKRCHD